MATQIRNVDAVIPMLAAAINDIKAQIGPASFFHLDKSEVTVTAANATDLPTALVLVNQILGFYKFHMADTLAHKVAGLPLASYVPAVDLASAIARANDVKAKFNVHAVSTTYHYTADVVIATADSTILSDLLTLLNAEKTALNTHVASGPAAKSIRVVSA